MATQIDEKALFFSHCVRQRMGANIRGIYLFGSHARGDHHAGSDYDFMVVLDNADPRHRNDILDIETDFLNRFDALPACVVYTEKDWEWRKNSPLGINILREGIAL
jgi:uncharacterized protein